MTMTKKQKKVFNRIMSIPVTEYDLADNLSMDVLAKMLIECTHAAGQITALQESPEISEKTRQRLKEDLKRLKEKHQLILSRFERGIALIKQGAAS